MSQNPRRYGCARQQWKNADSGNGMDQGIRAPPPYPTHGGEVYVPGSATNLGSDYYCPAPDKQLLGTFASRARPRYLPTLHSRPRHSASSMLRSDRPARIVVAEYRDWRQSMRCPCIAAGGNGSGPNPQSGPAHAPRDHHSFLMKPRAPLHSNRRSENRRPWSACRRAEWLISVPAYSGMDKVAAESYVQTVYDSLAAPSQRCRLQVDRDLRTNGGGNMWADAGRASPLSGGRGLARCLAGGGGPLARARSS